MRSCNPKLTGNENTMVTLLPITFPGVHEGDAKVNDYINVNFNFLLIYDEEQSLKRQIKEALQLGITYSFF